MDFFQSYHFESPVFILDLYELRHRDETGMIKVFPSSTGVVFMSGYLGFLNGSGGSGTHTKKSLWGGFGFFFLAKQQYLKLVSYNLYFRETANILVQGECIILNEKSINNSIWWVFNVKICSFLISHYMY